MLLPSRMDFIVSEQLVDFRCSRCGHLAQASVSVTGTGLAMGPVSLSNAELDARVGAVRTSRLAPCPRCGHRDRAALAKILLVAALVGALAGFTALLIVGEQLHGSGAGRNAGLQVGIATFVGAVVTITALKLRDVRRRVRFHRAGAR